MKPTVSNNRNYYVLPLLICFFLSSCSENSPISTYDEDPKSLRDSTGSGSITNLLDNSSLQRGCTAANTWVEEHADNLPTSFASISKYPAEYRKAIFIKLSADQKANIWSERLQEIVDNMTLNKKQHSLLGEIIKKLTPAVFDKNAGSDVINDRTLKSVFGETLAANIFSSLSPVQDVKENQTKSIVYEMNQILRNDEVSVSSMPPDCGCSSSSDYCGLGHDCATGYPHSCFDSEAGCGTFWMYSCDGLCDGWELKD